MDGVLTIVAFYLSPLDLSWLFGIIIRVCCCSLSYTHPDPGRIYIIIDILYIDPKPYTPYYIPKYTYHRYILPLNSYKVTGFLPR